MNFLQSLDLDPQSELWWSARSSVHRESPTRAGTWGSERGRVGRVERGARRAEAPDLEVAGPGEIQSGFCGLGGPGRVAGGGGAHSSRPGGRCRPERRGPAAGRMGRSAARGSRAAAASEAAARGSLTAPPFPL